MGIVFFHFIVWQKNVKLTIIIIRPVHIFPKKSEWASATPPPPHPQQPLVTPMTTMIDVARGTKPHDRNL